MSSSRAALPARLSPFALRTYPSLSRRSLLFLHRFLSLSLCLSHALSLFLSLSRSLAHSLHSFRYSPHFFPLSLSLLLFPPSSQRVHVQLDRPRLRPAASAVPVALGVARKRRVEPERAWREKRDKTYVVSTHTQSLNRSRPRPLTITPPATTHPASSSRPAKTVRCPRPRSRETPRPRRQTLPRPCTTTR